MLPEFVFIAKKIEFSNCLVLKQKEQKLPPSTSGAARAKGVGVITLVLIRIPVLVVQIVS